MTTLPAAIKDEGGSWGGSPHWKYFTRRDGHCILECAHCGTNAEYSSEAKAIENTPDEPHCVKVWDMPFMGEPIEEITMQDFYGVSR